jgi:hypothetical protein
MMQEGRSPGAEMRAQRDGCSGEALTSFVQVLSTETTTTTQHQASSHHSPPFRLAAAAPEDGSCADDSPRDTALELE